MPTTILDGETYEQALHRRYSEEAEGLDNFCYERELLAWAYAKLQPFSFSKQVDALMMDEIKLYLMEQSK